MRRSAPRKKRPTRAGGVSAAIFAKRTDAAALCGEKFGETAEFPRKYAAFA